MNTHATQDRAAEEIECLACGQMFTEQEVAEVPLGGGERDYVCLRCLGPGTWEDDDGE